MKLYEINDAIRALEDQMEIDPETGEILCDADAIQAEIGKLQMRRTDVLEYLARLVMNTRAEQGMLKAEEDRLSKRRKTLENKEARLMEVLQRECPENTNLGIATLKYRNTKRTNIFDVGKAYRWLKKRKLTECYRENDPTIFKPGVKKLFDDGQKVPGCSVEPYRTCSLS